MTETTDIATLMRDMRDLAYRIVECQGENSDGEEIIHLYDQSDTTFKAQNILLVLNAFEAERQRAEKAELELIKPLPIGELIQRLEGQTYEKWFSQSDLKGDQVPVGEIVAWAGTNRDMGITRDIDFRFFRFDVKPGTKLYAVEPAPAVKSDLLTRAEALAVETRALASRIQAGE